MDGIICFFVRFCKNSPSSRNRCISDASLRRLMQRLRDISKRADLKISETSPVRCIKDVSAETSLRSLRSSQRRLRVASETVIGYFQTGAFFGYLLIYLRVFNPHMHKMGPREPKHYIFGNQFYSKNARKLRFHVFLYFNARKHMISPFYLKCTVFARNYEFVPI